MIKVVSRRTIKPQFREEILELYREVVRQSRREAGCLSYEFFVDLDDPNTVVMIEEWEDADCLERHAATPHYRMIMEQLIYKQRSNDIRFLRQLL